ncbi:hypothetical protein ABIC86_000137 [Paenibacillus sp. DS2363]|uniref:hypothetical protein n=1 Tax=Paenibacillus sp. DS2363 TaxID=3156427 RepID=UPI0033986480
MNDQLIIGIQVQSDGSYGPRFSFSENDIMGIEMWKPSKNYNVPFFYTRTGNFTVLTTLNACELAFPNFKFLDGSNLVNIDNIERVLTGSYGGIAYFKDDIHTGINQKNLKVWKDIVDEVRQLKKDNRQIFGVEIVENGQLSTSGFFDACDIYYIDMWEPKANYYVPRFHTSKGLFTVGLTYKACAEAMPYLYPAHNGNLVNPYWIERIDEQIFGSTAIFKESDYRVTVARSKLKALKGIIN